MTRETMKRLRQYPAGLAGLAIVLVFLLMAMASWSGISGAGWTSISGAPWEMPGPDHWFGTNRLGQDIWARTVRSAGTAFETGLLVALVSTGIGAVLGGIAGWFSSSFIDEIILWLKGVIDSIPFYLFVAALAFAMKGSPWAMHIAMILAFWTGTGRLVRGEVMRLRNQDFVLSARAIGVPEMKILARHVIPNTAHILLVQASLVFVGAIKTEVILSFLGLGIQDDISWGLMLAESSQEVLAGQFGNFITASVMLFALLMGFNLLADALQDAWSRRETPA